jgi:hypothetical protein
MTYKAIQDPCILVKLCSVLSFEKYKLIFSIQRKNNPRFTFCGKDFTYNITQCEQVLKIGYLLSKLSVTQFSIWLLHT